MAEKQYREKLLQHIFKANIYCNGCADKGETTGSRLCTVFKKCSAFRFETRVHGEWVYTVSQKLCENEETYRS